MGGAPSDHSPDTTVDRILTLLRQGPIVEVTAMNRLDLKRKQVRAAMGELTMLGAVKVIFGKYMLVDDWTSHLLPKTGSSIHQWDVSHGTLRHDSEGNLLDRKEYLRKNGFKKIILT